MSHPIDMVLEQYEQDVKTRRDHAQMLNSCANTLVNQWPRDMMPLIEEISPKIGKFGLVIQGWDQNLNPGGKSVGSTLAIWGAYPNAFERRHHPAKLAFKLTNTGAVRVALASGAGFEARETPMGDAFPVEWVRSVLADYVGYCLRVGWE